MYSTRTWRRLLWCLLLLLWGSLDTLTRAEEHLPLPFPAPEELTSMHGKQKADKQKKSDKQKADKKKKAKKKKGTAPTAKSQPLSPEEQRRYDYYFLEAVKQKALRHYDVAFTLLQHCLSIQPYAASAHYELSQYYLFLKQPAQALQALEVAASEEPNNFWYQQALANLYLEQDEREKATTLLEQMTVTFPDRRDPLYSLLEIYNRTEQYDQVIGVLNRLEGFMGKNEQLSMEKYRIYLRMEDKSRAKQEIEALVNEYPAEARYRVFLGDFYLQQKKEEEAYRIYRSVLDEDPDNVLARYSLASYYETTGEKELYRQQIDSLLFNRKVEPQIKLGVMRQLIAENEQAETSDSTRIIKLFDRIMAEEPDEADLPMLYAQYLISKDMKEASLPVLRQIIEIDPANTAARLMLLSEAANKEKYEEIIQLCEAGVESNPDVPEFYFYLAIAYNHFERMDEAEAICRKALIHINPQTRKEIVSDFYNIIGDACHSKGKNQEAYEAYDKALEYNADNIGVLNNYAYYLSLERKELDKAEEMSYRTVKAEPQNATYLDTYAWILFVKGNYAQARIYIDEAIKNEKDPSSDILEHCGDIHAHTDDLEGALSYWKQALEKGSESKTLKQKISQKRYIAE